MLTTLVVGDQVFINAYCSRAPFARTGSGIGSNGSQFARYTAEIMATEAVHRALALQSLGKLGNDGVREVRPARGGPGPAHRQGGFYKITDAVTVLESAGFGFGKPGSKPGTAFNYDEVSPRTPTVPGVNTIGIS